MSLPKKFVEEIVHSANVEGKKLADISDADLSNIYTSLNELVVSVSTVQIIRLS